MSELKIRRRSRLKRKQAIALRAELREKLAGMELWDDDAAVEMADFDGQEIILVNNVIHGLMDSEAGPFLSVRGLLAYRPSQNFVTVDMGAIRFVHNGADVMAPGITEADAGLEIGSWCWIRDEKNGQPLAVGKAVMAGAGMVGQKGKAVQSVHHIGDKIWDLDAA